VIDLAGQPGELRFTIEVTRQATGKVETYEMVGHLGDAQQEGLDDGGNSHDSGAQRGD
jgi:hypothetical protein